MEFGPKSQIEQMPSRPRLQGPACRETGPGCRVRQFLLFQQKMTAGQAPRRTEGLGHGSRLDYHACPAPFLPPDPSLSFSVENHPYPLGTTWLRWAGSSLSFFCSGWTRTLAWPIGCPLVPRIVIGSEMLVDSPVTLSPAPLREITGKSLCPGSPRSSLPLAWEGSA